jgi:hypothetical protein
VIPGLLASALGFLTTSPLPEDDRPAGLPVAPAFALVASALFAYAASRHCFTC